MNDDPSANPSPAPAPDGPSLGSARVSLQPSDASTQEGLASTEPVRPAVPTPMSMPNGIPSAGPQVPGTSQPVASPKRPRVPRWCRKALFVTLIVLGAWYFFISPFVLIVAYAPYSYWRGPAAIDKFASATGCTSGAKWNTTMDIDTGPDVNATLDCHGQDVEEFRDKIVALTGKPIPTWTDPERRVWPEADDFFEMDTCTVSYDYRSSRGGPTVHDVDIVATCTVPIWTAWDLLTLAHELALQAEQ